MIKTRQHGLLACLIVMMAGCAQSPIDEGDPKIDEDDFLGSQNRRDAGRDAKASGSDDEDDEEDDEDDEDDEDGTAQDAGSKDSGTANDASTPKDAGNDAGPKDAGDAGPKDAGDAGPKDAGAGPKDASTPPADAGNDAGPADAGMSEEPMPECQQSSDCGVFCIGFGIFPCCRSDKTCGCTFTPGIYCI